jgi:hypothetical protein
MFFLLAVKSCKRDRLTTGNAMDEPEIRSGAAKKIRAPRYPAGMKLHITISEITLDLPGEELAKMLERNNDAVRILMDSIRELSKTVLQSEIAYLQAKQSAGVEEDEGEIPNPS